MTVDSTLQVDTTEIRRKIYYKYGRTAVDIVTSEMRTAFQDFGTIARDEANDLIKGGKESRLAKASKITVREGARDITAVVSWDAARSVAGFPYAAAVNTGRKAFGPVKAKVLVFEIDGKVIFTKWVKAFPGVHYTTKGLRNSMPKMISRKAKMRGNIVRRLQAPA